MIPTVPPRIFSLPLLCTSWAFGLLAWVLVWWALPACQGFAVALAGGQWIGLAVPPWTQPWALVNEPSVGFAATRTALWSYWLSPFLAAAVLALLLPQLPTGSSWGARLLLLHLALAAANLGFAWLPGLGVEDGLLAGLARFFGLDPVLAPWGGVALTVLLQAPPLAWFASHLWHGPGGPTPARKLRLWAAHLVPPAASWLAAVAFTAPQLPRRSLATFLAAQLLALALLLGRKPPHPLGARELGRTTPFLAWALVLLLAVPSWVAFAPAAGRPKGYLWGRERLTSNVRREVLRLPLKLPLGHGAPRGSSSPGS
jgi:phage shock protein PspC (stress-responsive transcriptional regulator)